MEEEQRGEVRDVSSGGVNDWEGRTGCKVFDGDSEAGRGRQCVTGEQWTAGTLVHIVRVGQMNERGMMEKPNGSQLCCRGKDGVKMEQEREKDRLERVRKMDGEKRR
ncbi:unnamed protein product [Pleuronectes platessa]|uniref:Uncharacterized protein n=1 Tax=Pleuronectes platessa TaxID=8262 RepID=A0A9N7VGW4_PLEPL|nr:unnamed protein product [Pleuronectes platessa]